MSKKLIAPKELTDREKRIEALRAKDGISRAHAASIIDSEEAAKNRKLPKPEEIAEQFKCEELKAADAKGGQ